MIVVGTHSEYKVHMYYVSNIGMTKVCYEPNPRNALLINDMEQAQTAKGLLQKVPFVDPESVKIVKLTIEQEVVEGDELKDLREAYESLRVRIKTGKYKDAVGKVSVRLRENKVLSVYIPSGVKQSYHPEQVEVIDRDTEKYLAAVKAIVKENALTEQLHNNIRAYEGIRVRITKLFCKYKGETGTVSVNVGDKKPLYVLLDESQVWFQCSSVDVEVLPEDKKMFSHALREIVKTRARVLGGLNEGSLT